MFETIKQLIKGHKIASIIVVIVLLGGGYYWYQKSHATVAVTKYVVQNATRSSVVVSISGTGQVQAGATISVTPKVSETVTSIPVRVGDHVTTGQALLQLDAASERRAVQSAQLSLQSAQLSLKELSQVTTSTLLQDQNAVRTGQVTMATASTTVAQDYQNGFDNLGGSFTNLQAVMTGLQDFVTGNDINKIQNDPDAYVGLMPSYLQASVLPYKNSLTAAYASAASAYQQNLSDYHAASRSADPKTLDSLFSETYATANSVSAAVKAGKDFLTYIVNTYPTSSSTKPLPSITGTLQSNFDSYTNTMASTVSGIQATMTGITNDGNSYANAQASLEQASETLAELTAGPTDTQLAQAQLNVQTAQNSLETAQENLAYTSVRAPISGVVSAINTAIGETPGSSAVTIVGDGEVALVTLNEIDAAKVAVGDKATLTFDAISALSLAGQVAEIDPVGTVSQGVVSYNAQVSFAQSDSASSTQQVKPGMSVTANIVTQADQNVIAVPNAAVMTSNGSSYVLEPSSPLSTAQVAASAKGGIDLAGAVKMVPVTTGLSNDTMTEITSGLNEGDQVIVQTIKSSSGSTGSSASGGTGSNNALRLLTGGGGGQGGGGVRTVSPGK